MSIDPAGHHGETAQVVGGISNPASVGLYRFDLAAADDNANIMQHFSGAIKERGCMDYDGLRLLREGKR